MKRFVKSALVVVALLALAFGIKTANAALNTASLPFQGGTGTSTLPNVGDVLVGVMSPSFGNIYAPTTTIPRINATSVTTTNLSVFGQAVFGNFTGGTYNSNTIGAGNTSGSNTGDETQASIKTKLGVATASVDGYLLATDFLRFTNGLFRTTTINNLATTTYTFATTTDTNISLTITTSTNGTITWNPLWTGTLADARITSAATWNAKQNAISAGSNLVLSGATLSVTTTPTFVSSTIANLNFTSATGTNLQLAGLFNFTNATGTNVTTTNAAFQGALKIIGSASCNLGNQALQTASDGTVSCGTLSGGGGGSGAVSTSTAGFFSFYFTSNIVTGTPAVQFTNGVLTINTSTSMTSTTVANLNATAVTSSFLTVTNLTATNATSSNLNATRATFGSVTSTNENVANFTATGVTTTNLSAVLSTFTGTTTMTTTTITSSTINTANITTLNVGSCTGCFTMPTSFTFTSVTSTNLFATNASSTNATTTNLFVSGALSLPANSVTDGMVVDTLTINGGTVNNSPIGASTPSTGVFTNVTTTNLNVSGVTNVAGLTFTTANGTSITVSNATTTNLNVSGQTVLTNVTSTNLAVTGLFTFANATGTSVSSTNLAIRGVLGCTTAGSQALQTDAAGNVSCGTIASGGGGGSGSVGTSTLGNIAFYNSNTSVTGTPVVTLLNGVFAISTNTTFTNATGTNLSLANALNETSGGTHQSSYTLGDTLYASGANTLSRLAGSTSTQTLYLSQTGSGSVSGAPSWQAIPSESVLSYYFYDAGADTTTYKLQKANATTTLVSLTTAAVTNSQVLQNWITPTGTPNIAVIPDGQYEFKIDASQSAGVQVTQLVGEFWEVSATGTDIGLIGTSNTSTVLTGSQATYTLFFTRATPYALASTASRIVTRVRAIVTLVGTAPTDILYYGGAADSHIEIPGSTVDASNFVPYSGATANLSLGSFSLSGSGLTFTNGTFTNVTSTNLAAQNQMTVGTTTVAFTPGQTLIWASGSSTSFNEIGVENTASGPASQACLTANSNTATPTSSFTALCANNNSYVTTSSLSFVGTANDQSLMFNTIANGGNAYLDLVTNTGTLYIMTGNTTTASARRLSIDATGNITLIGTSTLATTTISTSTITQLNATSLITGNVTSTNHFSTGLTFTNLSGTNATSTNLNASNFTFSNATGTNLNLSGLFTFVNATGTSVTSTNASFSGQLIIPTSAALVTTGAGKIGIDSTSGQLRANSGTATSTFSPFLSQSFTIPSSSLNLTGTTTVALGFAMRAETWKNIGCYTTSTAGTLATSTVRFGDGGNNWMTPIVATSSANVPITAVAANNSFAAGAVRYAQIGSIAGTFDNISCTNEKNIDPD